MDRIVALIDASPYSKSVIEHAAWVSARTGFAIDLLHVVPHRPSADAPINLTGNLTLGARSELLEKLSRHDEEAAQLARERGRALIDGAKAQAEGAGAEEVHTRLRTGGLLESVQELEDEARLIVIGKRGEHADFASMHLGSNLERVVRAAKTPVLVASRAFRAPQRALIAFDTGPSVAKAVDHIAKGKLFKGMTLHLLHAGEESRAITDGMDAASNTLESAGYTVETSIVSGEPETVIAEQTGEGKADLLVMGAYGHSRIRRLIIGSTTTQMIRKCLVPVLLFRPDTHG
ncbi:universal stress protein UspA [Marinicauda pacifica]|uniref:Universal stress protein n=1 Tax=Marinicauda pacifica TaxID=1133559 RepID=A0A4S2HBA4_9PROT|nr:universal stress protein [Marinicauda pacifica]TGY93176.1 universal stress protein [Marinicauda pacifica]GGE43511.1 universal stress protein UspA [Marinicauda pacifica]